MEKDSRLSKVEELLKEWYEENGGAYMIVAIDKNINQSISTIEGDTKRLASTVVTNCIVYPNEFGEPFSQVVGMFRHILDHPIKLMDFIRRSMKEVENSKEEES